MLDTEEQQQKKKLKNIVDSIPTDKNALFAYNVDWIAVEKYQVCMYVCESILYVCMYICIYMSSVYACSIMTRRKGAKEEGRGILL